MSNRPQFPESSIGLDSWASHHIVYEDPDDAPDAYPHQLHLAHGTCRCRIQLGRKGIPRCFVPRTQHGSNIDLFPEGLLWSRGCTVERGHLHEVRSPTGRVFPIQMWGNMPYMKKTQLNMLIQELPDHDQPERISDRTLSEPTAKRGSVHEGTESSGALSRRTDNNVLYMK